MLRRNPINDRRRKRERMTIHGVRSAEDDGRDGLVTTSSATRGLLLQDRRKNSGIAKINIGQLVCNESGTGAVWGDDA
jgi:hypothetical protein